MGLSSVGNQIHGCRHPLPIPPLLRKITTPLNSLLGRSISLNTQIAPFPTTFYTALSMVSGWVTTTKHIHAFEQAPNHPSAQEHPTVISKSLETEIAKGHLIGPLDITKFPYMQVSSLGVVPKKHSDKWRLILDLSHPKGQSVNDGIDRTSCSLAYIKVDDIVQQGEGLYASKN